MRSNYIENRKSGYKWGSSNWFAGRGRVVGWTAVQYKHRAERGLSFWNRGSLRNIFWANSGGVDDRGQADRMEQAGREQTAGLTISERAVDWFEWSTEMSFSQNIQVISNLMWIASFFMHNLVLGNDSTFVILGCTLLICLYTLGSFV